MCEIQASEARAPPPQLLHDVEHAKTIVITRQATRVAWIGRKHHPAQYDALARRELAWYARETSFDLSSKDETLEYRQVDVHNSGGTF
jgi:hypothetical protein